MDRQTVALLGGTGFIGSRLVNALIDAGKHVRIGTRRRDHARHLQMLPVDIVELDALDTRTLARFVAGAHAAINLIGVLHGGRGTPYGPGFERAQGLDPRKDAATKQQRQQEEGAPEEAQRNRGTRHELTLAKRTAPSAP